MFKLITKSKIDMKKLRLLPSAVLAANLLLKERVKDIAREIAASKTKGFTKEWDEYREKEYKYWLKRIRWACRPLQ